MKLLLAFLTLILLTSLPCQAASSAKRAQLPPGKPLTEITFAYFPLAVPISVLAETMQRDQLLRKALATRGFQLAFRPFAKGTDVMPLIREGRIAAVSFADMPTIEAVSTGDMLISGFVKQSYSAVVAASGTQIKDLRKKRIGNAYGSTSHYALQQALSSAGLSEKDITLVPMDVSQMLEALENCSIDAFAAWEPTPTAALRKHPNRFEQINRQTSFAFFLLSGSLVRSNPDVAREITAGLVRAINWLKDANTNLLTASRWAQAGAKGFTGQSSPLNEYDIARITRSDLLDIAGAPAIPKRFTSRESLLFKEFDFLRQIGRLSATASRQHLEQGFSSTLLHEVLIAPARYGLNRFEYARY